MHQNYASNSSSMNVFIHIYTMVVPPTHTGLIAPTRKCSTGEELVLGKRRPVHVTTPAPDLVLRLNATATKMILPGVRMKAILPIKKTCPLQRCVLEMRVESGTTVRKRAITQSDRWSAQTDQVQQVKSEIQAVRENHSFNLSICLHWKHILHEKTLWKIINIVRLLHFWASTDNMSHEKNVQPS